MTNFVGISTNPAALPLTATTLNAAFSTKADVFSPSLTTRLTLASASANDPAQIVVAATNNIVGANILLQGNGSTTPNKTIRAANGSFQFVNSAYTAVIMTIDDVGNVATNGSITTSGNAVITTAAIPASGGLLATSGSAGASAVATTTQIGASSFTATGGSNLRTIADRASDILNVRDFGAFGGGVIDDTAAIQAAITALGTNGGVVYLPPGVYKITSTLTVTNNFVRLLGAGFDTSGGTTIRCDTLSIPIFYFSGMSCSLSYIAMIYNGTATSGACAIYSSGSNNVFDNFRIVNPYVGMTFTSGTAQYAHHFQIFNYIQIGIYATSVNDVFIDSFILNAGNATYGSLGGIRLFNKVEAFVATNGDVLQGVYSITTDASSYVIGQRPAYNKFTNVYFDSSNSHCGSFNNSVVFTFTNCWFSGGRSGTGFNGVYLYQTDSFRFVNTDFFNCGFFGARVSNASLRTAFSGCTFESNSYSSGVNVGHGLYIDPGTTDFSIQGCIAHNGLFSGQQGYGIIVNTGASDRYIVSGNLVHGNYTGGFVDGGTGTNKFIGGNIA